MTTNFIKLLFLCLTTLMTTRHVSCQDDLAGSFFSGLLDTITSTENSKDCPGVCVHALATLICYEVLEEVKCPTAGMKCCVESSSAANSTSTTTHRPYHKATATTTRVTTTIATTEAPSNKKDNDCPGVCVADRIADYCEAYLKTPNLCKPSTKCCVAKDSYLDNPDLRVLIGTQNSNNKTPLKPQKTSEKIHSHQNNHHHEPPKSKTNPPGKYTKPQSTKKPLKNSSNNGQGQIFNECEGECVSGLFALFCDDIDTNAFCPNEGSCCMPAGSASEKEVQTTTPKITTPPPLPRCPGFCLLNIMAAFCEKPAVVIQRTQTCQKGSICCDNTRVPQTPKPRPTTRRPTTTTPPPPPPVSTLPPDPREECPGTCIVGLLSFTCFKNAEITDLFKCKKSGTQCCAPKSKIQEQLDRHNRYNHTYPYNPNLGPLNPNYPHPGYYTNYPPPPPPNYHPNYQPQAPQPPPPPNAPNNNYLQPQQSPHVYEPTQPSNPFESNDQTSSPRPPPYSKYVCGVKGTIRAAKEYLTLQGNDTDSSTRMKRALSYEQQNFNKSSERLILGSSVVPIPIFYDDNTTFSLHHEYSKYNNRQARVVGGEDGDNGEWCWQVALINSQNQYLCGGALIGTQWVLTAAHCVTNIVRSGDAIYVRVGDYDLTRKYGSPGAQTLKVATTYIHHNHNSQTLDNDIALLKLLGQADLKEGVCLVCLPARGVNHAAGKRCTVTGYGYMGESGPIPLRVREAEIPIVSDSECIRKINAVTEKIFILPASSFCAGGISGNDACQGDGGGPLVCQDDGFFELAGLVSWGFGCGREDVPGVYVKVSSFIGWINQIISVNNS